MYMIDITRGAAAGRMRSGRATTASSMPALLGAQRRAAMPELLDREFRIVRRALARSFLPAVTAAAAAAALLPALAQLQPASACWELVSMGDNTRKLQRSVGRD